MEQYNKPVLMGGDFNMIMNSVLHYNGSVKQNLHNRFSKEVETFMEELKLIDIWRDRNPLKRQYTFTKNNPFMQSRLDHWLISEDLESLVIRCDIVPHL